MSSEAADPDTEVISEDELPTVQVVKVPETEEVSDEELPGPKRAELPADTEVRCTFSVIYSKIKQQFITIFMIFRLYLKMSYLQ